MVKHKETIGCLCLHGFTGSPWELEPLAERLKQKYHWLVYTPVLPGHEAIEQLKEASYKNWILKADIALQELLNRCEKVFVIGFSMGGLLATYLAARYQVEKLVLLGAAAEYFNAGQLMKDVVHLVEYGIKGQMKEHPYYRFLHDKIKTPVRALTQFQKLVKTITPFISTVQIPVFIGQGVEDGIVPKKSAIFIYEEMNQTIRQLHLYQESKHFLLYDKNREQVMNDVETFLMTDIEKSTMVLKSIE
ncbi:alpha/beta hydrolase [Aliibacillus thermotolerans]|uniref:Alpha/beta hydrolase n=1 Tax=Aliibacillus thermotolerans TaxID=1834418 RepID=A0ABW0U4A7_9BACI|nr:alpha/beta fold hydrolase [Aliibacillus thermotolerans]MDA3128733.1 alpha/beta fold hydrolase [Aliibacillus thermotolerans]